MGKIDSRAKGATAEREVAQILREAGYEARRGCQHAGGPDSPDVVGGPPGWHLEVKRTEKLQLWPAWDQCVRDKADCEKPCVLHRKNKRDWVAVISFSDFLKLVKAASEYAPSDVDFLK